MKRERFARRVMRRCSKCGAEKPLSEYYADKSGKRRACKVCCDDYKKAQRGTAPGYSSREGQPCKCCKQVRDEGHRLDENLRCQCGCGKSWTLLQKRGVRL